MNNAGRVFCMITCILACVLAIFCAILLDRLQIQSNHLADYRATCTQALIIAEKKSILEEKLREDYARITLKILKHLGIKHIPIIDRAIVDVFMKKEQKCK